MEVGPSFLASARADFRQARQQAAMQDVLARFRGGPTTLLPFDEAYKKLKASGMVERGLKDIPVDAIVGSVNRYSDFTRSFLPRLDSDSDRWATVKALALDPTQRGLEPITAYQIGDAYFVSDGNHRVSVAKQMGTPTIEAYVIEVTTRVSLSATASPEELILKSELADFLERNRLDLTRPTSDLMVTVPGQYIILDEQIEDCQKQLSVQSGAEVPLEEAAANWYDTAYLPVVLSIRDRGILRDFPGRTETDLFIFISQHRTDLEQELGWEVTANAAAQSLVSQPTPSTGLLGVLADGPAAGEWRKDKIEDRYTDHLFADILVPLSGDEVGWNALTQSILIAKREGSRLNGLHIVATEADRDTDSVHQVREIFDRHCAEAGVTGSLAVDVGDISASVCNRAVLNDLVVVNLAHPPAAQRLARLSSGFRTLIRRCARPILAVPGTSTPLSNILLSYDGSPKAKEALFVATYFAEQWKAALTVLTIIESEASHEAVTHARQYLEMHELQANFVEHEKVGPSDAILSLAKNLNSDLIVMGGYSKSPMVEIVVGSAVDQVLRESEIPMLICR
jgi:nucleotide-binding universal stress UspA family protein